jgi:Tol biopolymer transport system component
LTASKYPPEGWRLIALSNWGGDFPPRNLYAMHADGSGLRQITSGNYFEVDPAWSPDSAESMFSSTRCCATANSSRNYALYTIRPNGTKLHKLQARVIEDQASERRKALRRSRRRRRPPQPSNPSLRA